MVHSSALIAKEPGLFQVVRRIAQLEDIAKSLEKDGDRHKVLPNVMAIRDAYRTRQLDIHEGLVTYWFQGEMLCEPRPRDNDEFLAVSQHFTKQSRGKEFWEEDIRPQI
jgi:hypothetical protein